MRASADDAVPAGLLGLVQVGVSELDELQTVQHLEGLPLTSPHMKRDKRLVGIVSLGDLSRLGAAAEETLAKISQPGGQHSH